MTPSKPFRVIIVGGGIAGVAAGIALRGEGRTITILEQSSQNKEIGATISLQPNASRILHRQWRLADSLERARGMIDKGFRIYNTEGRLVNEIPLHQKTEYDGERIVYHRVDLHEALKGAATSAVGNGDPIVIRTSSKVESCDCEKGVVTLAGGETLEAELVIGADGIHSAIRRAVLEDSIHPVRTGLSAYRLMVPNTVLEEKEPEFCEKIHPRESYTSMVMAHNCRLIMGPARNGEVYSIVGLVPDEQMSEDSDSKQSWVSRGDLDKMLDTYKDFPDWAKAPFRHSKDIGLWQLRDLDPLRTWYRGRVILIGDAAHAMLPTQGQGASQAVEDAEALGAFFDGDLSHLSGQDISNNFGEIFECRYTRASLVQKYSREAAKPATEKGSSEIKM